MSLLVEKQLQALERLALCPRILNLDTHRQTDSVSLLRRVWAAALARTDSVAWQEVSEGRDVGVRPFAFADARQDEGVESMCLRWIIIGDGIKHDAALVKAWNIAAEAGLGSWRIPFRIVRMTTLGPDGTPTHHENAPWRLAQARWPLGDSPADTPCRLAFRSPVYLERQDSQVLSPTLTNIVAFARRRVASYLSDAKCDVFAWSGHGRAIEELAEAIPSVQGHAWRLERVKRYSTRQEREIWLSGVRGCLDLPEGPGQLWPLLLAASWIQVGKHTTEGLGYLTIEPFLNDNKHDN